MNIPMLNCSVLNLGVLGMSLAVFGFLDRSAYGQEAESQYRTLPLDPAGDKRKKEKDELLSPERLNTNGIAGVERYYRENLLPRLLQENAVSMNDARNEWMNDIELVERRSRNNAGMLEEYNKMVARLLNDVIVTKDEKGKLAHPSSRVVAAVIAGRLNRQAPSSQGGGLPDPEGTKILLRIFQPSENDGMVAAALTHLPRHWIWPGMDGNMMELARKRFVSNVEAFLGAQKPAARGDEEESYLRELMIENLTIIAEGESESAKAARPVLVSLIKPAVEKYNSESEWLVETAIHSFGQLSKPELTPEELVEFEVNTIKFLQASLRSWNRRCARTSASAPGGGTPGGMGPGGGYPGGMGGGPGAGGAGGGNTGGDDEGGGGVGRPGAGGSAPRPKNPYDEQPKEVKIARRILQQRLERIHYGLNGYGKVNSTAPTKGILAVAEEGRKSNLNDVIAAIEALQTALNEDSIKGLDSLVNDTKLQVSALQEACDAIVGSDGQVDLPVEAAESSPSEGDDEADSGSVGK
ncbi:MAG: hypothetical protein MUF23_10650 [Pirellula sp.]|nr:hypothetical protein [Pirellula sp.]